MVLDMSRIDKNYFQERFSYSAEQNGSIFQWNSFRLDLWPPTSLAKA